VWTRLLGSPFFNVDIAYSVDTATDGSIYIVGETSGDLDGQTNVGTSTSDIFIAKYHGDGSKAWVHRLGSEWTGSNDIAKSIDASTDGIIYIAGITDGNLDGQTGGGRADAFIAKYIVSPTNAPPTTLNLSVSSFNENISSGSAVATLSTIDPDAGDSFT